MANACVKVGVYLYLRLLTVIKLLLPEAVSCNLTVLLQACITGGPLIVRSSFNVDFPLTLQFTPR